MFSNSDYLKIHDYFDGEYEEDIYNFLDYYKGSNGIQYSLWIFNGIVNNKKSNSHHVRVFLPFENFSDLKLKYEKFKNLKSFI